MAIRTEALSEAMNYGSQNGEQLPDSLISSPSLRGAYITQQRHHHHHMGFAQTAAVISASSSDVTVLSEGEQPAQHPSSDIGADYGMHHGDLGAVLQQQPHLMQGK